MKSHLGLRVSACIVGMLGIVGLGSSVAVSAADARAELVIKDHKFIPAELKVPANQRIRLTVHNQDSGPEEFESHALNREKIIPGGAKGVIFIGPLSPGRYEFEGEFHADSAKGVVIVE